VARYVASLDSDREPSAAFAYVSDFSTTREWDPNVLDAERVGDGPIGAGSRFKLTTSFAGRRASITYEISEHDPPRAVTFRGENATVLSVDRVTFEPIGAGTRVTYDADLRFKGPLQIADPLLQVILNRLGRQALAGMREQIGPAAGE